MSASKKPQRKKRNALRSTKPPAPARAGKKVCQRLQDDIWRRILHGPTRYVPDSLYAKLRRDIDEFGASCDSSLSKYFHLLLLTSTDRIKMPVAVRRALTLAEDQNSSSMCRMLSLRLAAKQSLLVSDFSKNEKMRHKALRIAEDSSWADWAFIILVNWAFASATKGHPARAKELLGNATEVLRKVGIPKIRSNPEGDDVLSRYFCQRGRAYFLQAKQSGQSEPLLIDRGIAEYRRAIKRDKFKDHRRINMQIEFAEQLIEIASLSIAVLEVAHGILREAGFGLDTHHCSACRAYYFVVSSKMLISRAQYVMTFDRSASMGMLHEAEAQIGQAATTLQETSHPYLTVVEEVMASAKKEIEKIGGPTKIFLSHKSSNSSLVRRFYRALVELGFDVWLDDQAMPAGRPLLRSIKKGFEESCAVVFFITPEFRDERYLEQEINYALAEKIQKGNDFSIVTLVFEGDDGKRGVVPKMLEDYVFKEPISEIDALIEIIRALPLKLPFPRRPS